MAKKVVKEVKNVTECICVLDKSGSMYSLTKDTIGGYNRMLEEQKKIPGDAYFTLILFDGHVNVTYENIHINEVNDLTESDYHPSGITALYDAIGYAIESASNRSPNKVIITIFTDGEENASRNFNKSRIKEMITEKQNAGWEFVFIGAGIDAMRDGTSLGFDSHKIYSVDYSSKGMSDTFNTVSHCYFQARQ